MNQNPSDLFDSFDIDRLVGSSPPEANSVPTFNLLDSILSKTTGDANVIIPSITTMRGTGHLRERHSNTCR